MQIELYPLGISLQAEAGDSLRELLVLHGMEFPCGGTNRCGGCRVRVLEGVAPISPEDAGVFSPADLEAGWRLACRLRADGPLKLQVDQWNTPILADDVAGSTSQRRGLGIAIDLGTTTIAAQLLDLATGNLLGLRSSLNPQMAYGADVMSRVACALHNDILTTIIRRALDEIVVDLAGARRDEVVEVAIVGNTVMHHLFCGLDVKPLAGAPFESPSLGERIFSPAELQWRMPSRTAVRLLPCVGGFVGSDTLAGIAAVQLQAGERLRALIDLGTNGEIAVGNRDRVLCASTAAGPAFEAGSITMGMRAAAGAIAHVAAVGQSWRCAVIGNVEPRGICGSGLVDAVAVGLDSGAILPSGRLAQGARELRLAGTVTLGLSDVRELQLAKGAVACGLRLLLERWGASLDDLETVYLAGAFGNYVDPRSAARIGLLEAAPGRVAPAGNTALRGAKMLLGSDCRPLLSRLQHVYLASDPNFQDRFVECIPFSGDAAQAAGR